MFDSRAVSLVVALVVCAAVACLGQADLAAKDSRVAELQQLRGRTTDGVISLTEEVFKKFVAGKSRPYTLALFYTAKQVIESNPQLQLPALRVEYGYAAKAFARGPDADKIFFMEVLLEDFQAPFALLQVNSLPYIVRFQPGVSVVDSNVDIGKSDKMLPDTVESSKYPWPAEVFTQFFSSKGLQAAETDRPSFVKSGFFVPTVLLCIAGLVYLVYMMWATNFLQHPVVLGTGSLLVFWFSVSGGMFNIIRGMPLYIRDKEGRLQFFLNSRQAQLGAEGFIIGSTYILFSGALALMIYVMPRIADPKARNSFSFVLFAVASFAVYKALQLWMLKSGYTIVHYLW